MWAEHAAVAVHNGTSGCQTAIPDGKYSGDTWFITTPRNEIITMMVWNGAEWLDMAAPPVYQVQVLPKGAAECLND